MATAPASGRRVGIAIAVPTQRKVSSMTGASLKGAKANPLDSFFPFDPCLLRAMHDVIGSRYRSWQGVPGLDYDYDYDCDCDDDDMRSAVSGSCSAEDEDADGQMFISSHLALY